MSDVLAPIVRMLADRQQLEPALVAIYDAYGDRLHRWLTIVGGDPHLADEAVQEVFMAIARQPDGLATADRFDAYLFMVARNALRQLQRRDRRHQRGERLSFLQLDGCTELGAEVDQDTHRLLEDALRQLPDEQREVVALKCNDDRTFKEIGEILDISPNTAASRWRYAMNHLRKRLENVRHVL